MPLPSNYSVRTVHGKWIALPDGSPATGTVTFTASVAHLVSSSDELVILTKPITVTLDSSGEATAELPTTDDPDVSPTGFTYSVVEQFSEDEQRAYSIDVPAGTEPVELATVIPVAPVTPTGRYIVTLEKGAPGGVATLGDDGLVPDDQVPVSSVNGATGDVTLNASDVGALPDTFTAPVQSVNTQTGDVSLTASDVGAAGSGHNHDTAYAAAGHTHPEPDHPVDSVDGRTGAVTLGDLYADAGHSHTHPVTSVNTQTGDVTLDAADVGASPDTHHHDADYAASGHNHDAAYAASGHGHDYPVDSVDGRTGDVTLGDLYSDAGHNHDADYAASGHNHDADYAATGHTHPDPDFPVDSVNGETGDVVLGASDVGASPSGHDHDAAYAAAGHGHDYPVDSVNGETGSVSLSASDVGASPDTHDHDAAYAAAGHGHSTFTGSSVDVESSNNLSNGDPAPLRINDPTGGELIMDQNQVQHNDADGSPGILFINFNGGGTTFGDVVRIFPTSLGSSHTLIRPEDSTFDSMIHLGSTRANIRTNADDAWSEIMASAHSTPSARADKTDIQDPPFASLDVVRGAPSRMWRYRRGRPTEPLHMGPMADDLPPELVVPADPEDGTPDATDLRDLVGVLWAAVAQLDAKITRLTAE